MMAAKPVYPAPSVGDYVADDLQIVESDSDQMMDVVSSFEMMASLDEGVSGRKRIDTTYENFSESEVEAPRSDWTDDVSLRGKPVSSSTVRRPAPYDVKVGRYPHRRF
jgi:hypothetical protein